MSPNPSPPVAQAYIPGANTNLRNAYLAAAAAVPFSTPDVTISEPKPSSNLSSGNPPRAVVPPQQPVLKGVLKKPVVRFTDSTKAGSVKPAIADETIGKEKSGKKSSWIPTSKKSKSSSKPQTPALVTHASSSSGAQRGMNPKAVPAMGGKGVPVMEKSLPAVGKDTSSSVESKTQAALTPPKATSRLQSTALESLTGNTSLDSRVMGAGVTPFAGMATYQSSTSLKPGMNTGGNPTMNRQVSPGTNLALSNSRYMSPTRQTLNSGQRYLSPTRNPNHPSSPRQQHQPTNPTSQTALDQTCTSLTPPQIIHCLTRLFTEIPWSHLYQNQTPHMTRNILFSPQEIWAAIDSMLGLYQQSLVTGIHPLDAAYSLGTRTVMGQAWVALLLGVAMGGAGVGWDVIVRSILNGGEVGGWVRTSCAVAGVWFPF